MSLLPASPMEKALWTVLVLLVVGFMAGAWSNRRRSKALGQWLQDGVRVLGGQTTWKWVGGMNSGAQVSVTGASQPFKSAVLSYFLLTREFAPLWALEWLRGKRDTLAIRADLRVPPAREFEVVPLQGKLRKLLDQNAGELPWHWTALPSGLSLATRGEPGGPLLASLRSFLERYGNYVQRLSLRKRQPGLVLFVNLAGLEKSPASEFLRAVRGLSSMRGGWE